jgi:hypothetical protein
VHFEGENTGERCDAYVGPDQPAQVTLDILSGIALAGLQGKFALYPTGLHVTKLEPVGVASGMHLEWNPTDVGASFLLFAESGAPIPGRPPGPLPILRVTVAAPPGIPIPDATRIYTLDMLGSDEKGAAVYECPGIMREIAVLHGGIICRIAPCDLNGDAVADVRDLVLMVHCILGTGLCPDPASPILDCNHDGTKSLDDVLCCAHAILRGGLPSDTTGGRFEPGVAVHVRDAVRTINGVDLPLTLVGADRVGAARLELAFPSARYDVAGVDLAGDASGWLNLHEESADRLVVGLIGLWGKEVPVGPTLDLVVHLTLKPDQTAGGEVTLVGTQFSGRDGVGLTVDVGQPSRPLGPPARVALSASRPNPFSRETHFAATLSAAADLDVSVYDLQGRVVANLYHAHAEAGSVDLVWRRTRSDGSQVPSGIYFLRATADGVADSRKVLVMSRE